MQGLVPDFVLRPVIRALCRQRLREIDEGSFEANYAAKMKWIEGVRARSKIADLTEKANEQHYEVCVTAHSLAHVEPTSVSGIHGIHVVLFGTVCEVLLLSLPYWEGNLGASGDPHA